MKLASILHQYVEARAKLQLEEWHRLRSLYGPHSPGARAAALEFCHTAQHLPEAAPFPTCPPVNLESR